MTNLKEFHFGITSIHKSASDKALRITQAVYPDAFSPIETGVYSYEDETVFCLSTQVGCKMGCTFCKSTGPFDFPDGDRSKRFQRNLRASEIIVQAYEAACIAQDQGFPKRPYLFSFMGMGEPLDNYQQVKTAVGVLGKIYRNSRATISTICQNPKAIRTLAKDIVDHEFPILIKLHFSLHAPNDALRRKLMPASATLTDTLEAVKDFARMTGLRVKANYTLMNGLNNLPEHEDQLVNLLIGTGIVLKISDFNSDDPKKIVRNEEADEFTARIQAKGIETSRFRSLGKDIGARCGELTLRQTNS